MLPSTDEFLNLAAKLLPSLSSQTTPTPRSYPYVRKCALDVGDYGLGLCANSLELGCDCLGHIKYFDGHIINAKVGC